MRLVLPPDLKPHSFLTLEEAADLLHVKVRWMRAAIEENRIGPYKIGRLLRIQVANLFAFVAAGRVETDRRVERPGRPG
jgi:excisionase family DNA binding protein